jgi:hypothetical protein
MMNRANKSAEKLILAQTKVSSSEAVRSEKGIRDLLENQLKRISKGEWRDHETNQSFFLLNKQLKKLDRVLGSSVSGHPIVAILLPFSVRTLVLNTYLIQKGICVINLSPELSNEERMCILRSNGVNLLITTNQNGFSNYSPDAAEVIFLHEIESAMLNHLPVMQIKTKARTEGIDTRYLFPTREIERQIVTMVCEKNTETGVCCRTISSSELCHLLEEMSRKYRYRQGDQMIISTTLSELNGLIFGLFYPILNDLRVELRP